MNRITVARHIPFPARKYHYFDVTGTHPIRLTCLCGAHYGPVYTEAQDGEALLDDKRLQRSDCSGCRHELRRLTLARAIALAKGGAS